jgi:hypothetical protein
MEILNKTGKKKDMGKKTSDRRQNKRSCEAGEGSRNQVVRKAFTC